jgi:hypothetical protein
MPPVRSLVFKYYILLISTITLFSEIMPFCSRYIKKKLLYVTIIAISSYQYFFGSKYIKLNIHLSCNIKSVSNAKYIFISLYYLIL